VHQPRSTKVKDEEVVVKFLELEPVDTRTYSYWGDLHHHVHVVHSCP
jgi:hypothetical protein